jgi:hypothetical protein
MTRKITVGVSPFVLSMACVALVTFTLSRNQAASSEAVFERVASATTSSNNSLQARPDESFHTAERTLEGIESINMMRKGQVKRSAGSDARGQAKFVASLFQVAA